MGAFSCTTCWSWNNCHSIYNLKMEFPYVKNCISWTICIDNYYRMLHIFKFSGLYTKLLKGCLVFRKTSTKKNWVGINISCQQAQTRKKQLVKVNTFDTILPDLNIFRAPWQAANSCQLCFSPEVEQFTQEPRQQAVKSSSGVPAIKYGGIFL